MNNFDYTCYEYCANDFIERLNTLQDMKEDLEAAVEFDSEDEEAEANLEKFTGETAEDELEELKRNLPTIQEADDAGSPIINDNNFNDYIMNKIMDTTIGWRDIPEIITDNIDWEGVADDAKHDYTVLELMGETYYFLN